MFITRTLLLNKKSADNHFYRWDYKVLEFNFRENHLQIELLSLSVQTKIAKQRDKWRKYTCRFLQLRLEQAFLVILKSWNNSPLLKSSKKFS